MRASHGNHAHVAARTQEAHIMEDEYWLTPFRHRRTRWTPAFWTPYRRVAEVYARRHSLSIWKAVVRAGEPYWEFRHRDCRFEALELVDIFKRFVTHVAGDRARRRPTFEPTTDADLTAWSQTQRSRTGWMGDLVAAILCILRFATDERTVPNVILFDGDWALEEREQTPSAAPEIVILHPKAITHVEIVED